MENRNGEVTTTEMQYNHVMSLISRDAIITFHRLVHRRIISPWIAPPSRSVQNTWTSSVVEPSISKGIHYIVHGGSLGG